MNGDILDDDVLFQKAATAESAKEILKLKAEYADLHTKVKHGRNAIWWMTGLFFLAMLIEGATYDFEPFLMGFNLAIVALMAGTGFLSLKKPFLGFLLGALLIVILQTLIVVGSEGVEWLRGLIPRIIILYFIIVGMNAAKQYLVTLKGLKSHGIKVEGSELV